MNGIGPIIAYIVSIEDWERRQAGLPLVHEEQEAEKWLCGRKQPGLRGP